jgi:hypothetical protein
MIVSKPSYDELVAALRELKALHDLASTAPMSSKAAFDAHLPLDRVVRCWEDVGSILARTGEEP